MLSWIYHSLASLERRNPAATDLRRQSLSIIRQRDTNMSPDLQTKLGALNRQQRPTKLKLRYVWDVVIQGNIGEIDSATKAAIEAVQGNFAEFTQLFEQFPNNRFVAREYAKFVKECTTDYSLWSEIVEKTQHLRRGISVNLDDPHEFGMDAFPRLPERARPKAVPQPTQSTEPSSTTTLDTGFESTDQQRTDIDQVLTLRHRIEDLDIPAITRIRRVRIVCFILFLFAPTIFALLYLHSFIQDLLGPLEFLSTLSILNVYAAQIAAFAFRLIGEGLELFPVQATSWNDERLPQRLGRTWDTRVQLRSILATASSVVEAAASFRAFPGCESAKESFFKKQLDYQFYISTNSMSVSPRSLQAAFVELIVLVEDLGSGNMTLNTSVVDRPIVLNTLANLDPIEADLEHVRDLLFSDITGNVDSIIYVCNIVFGLVLFVVAVTGAVPVVLEVLWIKWNKEEAYRALVAIPKNAVSVLSESLRFTKKNADDLSNQADLNSQDENILKVFNTVGSTSAGIWDMSITIVGSCVKCLLTFANLIIIYFFLRDCTESISMSAPHGYYICDSYLSNLMGLFGVDLRAFDAEVPIPIAQNYSNVSQIVRRLEKGRLSYQKLSLGDSGITPFPDLSEFTNIPRDCTTIPKSAALFSTPYCYPPDILLALIEPAVNAELLSAQVKGEMSSGLNFLWHVMISPLFDEFMFPMYEAVLPQTFRFLSQKESDMRIPVIIILIVQCIIEIIVWLSITRISNHIRAVLRMMLAIPAEVLLATPKVMKVLGGDFSGARTDALNRDTDFFEALFVEIPIPVLYASSEGIIQAANTACLRLFAGKKIVGENLEQLFGGPDFVGIDFANEVFTGTYQPQDAPPVRLELHLQREHHSTIVIVKDRNDMMEYETQIEERNEAMNQMLARILPAAFLKKIRKEADRTYGLSVVQLSSIIFLNFVKFSTWTETVSPAVALDTLNCLWDAFDGIVARKPTLTRIKTMGDIYMAAGGIFSEVNQPHEHATEALTFGLEAIREVKRHNVASRGNLLVRAGQDIGGPVFAGVIPTDRPTFEVLGAVVRSAIRLEKAGVPMAVAVSRGVYELLERTAFSITERSTVDASGTATAAATYIVNA